MRLKALLCVFAIGSVTHGVVAQGPGPNPFATNFAACDGKALDISLQRRAGGDAGAGVDDAISCGRKYLDWALTYAKAHPELVDALKRRQEAFASYVRALPEQSRDRIAELKSRLDEAVERIATEGHAAGLVQH